MSNGTTLRYGDQGQLHVNIAGENTGTWFDFTQNKSGNLSDLVQYKQNFDLKTSTSYLQSFITPNPANDIDHIYLNHCKQKSIEQQPTNQHILLDKNSLNKEAINPEKKAKQIEENIDKYIEQKNILSLEEKELASQYLESKGISFDKSQINTWQDVRNQLRILRGSHSHYGTITRIETKILANNMLKNIKNGKTMPEFAQNVKTLLNDFVENYNNKFTSEEHKALIQALSNGNNEISKSIHQQILEHKIIYGTEVTEANIRTMSAIARVEAEASLIVQSEGQVSDLTKSIIRNKLQGRAEYLDTQEPKEEETFMTTKTTQQLAKIAFKAASNTHEKIQLILQQKQTMHMGMC